MTMTEPPKPHYLPPIKMLKSFVPFARSRTVDEWLTRIAKASHGDSNLFQKLLRICWWDTCEIMDSSKMKEYMNKDFDPDTVAEIDVRKALLELGYSELYAAIRSHCSLQFWKPRPKNTNNKDFQQ